MSNVKRLELKTERLQRRKRRVRGAVVSTIIGRGRPRLAVHRTHKHIYAQIIDDANGVTLVSAASLDKGLKETVGKDGGNKKGAALIGEEVAKRAMAKGISQVVFDRAGHRYHGRVKELADAARKAGLSF